jgi:glycosyltransferase involved in cell wall biosynthesis
MRICLVTQEYPPETAKGGIGTQAFIKAHGFARLGHEAHVLSRSLDQQRHSTKTGEVSVTRIPGGGSTIFTDIADWLTYSSAVAMELSALQRERPFDIIEFAEWAAEGFVHLLNRGEWNYAPVVIQLHGPLVMFAQHMGWPATDTEFYRTGTYLEGTCLRFADGIYSSSHCSTECCGQHYGVNGEQIPRLHAGVDVKMFTPKDVAKDSRPTIVFVGKLVANKGIKVLVEAAARLVKEFPDLRLTAIGRSSKEMLAELHNIAAAHGANRLLDLVGFLPREELPERLSRAHVFAGPSQYEPGPGLVYLEAMACGLPVVACSGAGGAEVVIPGQTGCLVPPENPAALATALRELLANEPERARLGVEARAYAEREADSDKCIRRIEQFYRDVIRRSQTQRRISN